MLSIQILRSGFPTEQIKVPVNGKNLFLYDIEVDGVLRQLALVKKKGSLARLWTRRILKNNINCLLHPEPVPRGSISTGKTCPGGDQSSILPLFA